MTADLTPAGTTLDASAVRALVELLGDDQEALAEIVETFLVDAPQRLAEPNDGVSAGDSRVFAVTWRHPPVPGICNQTRR